MANILDLAGMPHIQNTILEHLQLRDALAFRSTCREIRKWVEKADFNIKLLWGGQSATVDLEQVSCFDAYSDIPFVVSNLRITNYSYPQYLHTTVTADFLQKKGSGVKTLRLETFYGRRFEEEFDFLQGLTGLQNLFTDYLDLNENFGMSPGKLVRIPPSIQNLKTLTVLKTCNITGALQQFLDILEAPRFTTTLKLPTNYLSWFPNVGQYFQDLLFIVRKRQSLQTKNKSNYTHVDILDISLHFQFAALPEFFIQCETNAVRVLNVSPPMFIEYNTVSLMVTFMEGAAESIESLLGWHCSFKGLRSESLRALRIPSTNSANNSAEIPDFIDINETYFWPNLQLLQITFDTQFNDVVKASLCIDIIKTLHIGPVCLPQSIRNLSSHAVSELEFSFIRCSNGETLTPAGIICPLSIVRHYPNVKTFKVTGWDAFNDSWEIFWEGLPLLEELYIDDCRNLGDWGFIGRHREEPEFLKLKKLQKLTLKVTNMPNISNMVFRNVLAHMPLTEFNLYFNANDYTTHVTLQAVWNLSNDEFSDSVIKFPFNTFAFRGTDSSDLERLKHRFPKAYF